MTTTAPRVLVIEDEPEIRRFLRTSLSAHEFEVQEAATGQEGLRRASEQPPDVVLLDLGLPDLDGFAVIRQVRGWSSVPIIVVSARGQEADKIAALDFGADDYLTKPFGIGELLARLRVALRHQSRLHASDPSPVFTAGELCVDLERRQVLLAGSEVHLTPTEYRLLTTFIKHAGRVLTHRQLLKEVWGPDCTHETHYLRVYTNQLRHKLGDAAGPSLILTEPGVGYRLQDSA